MTIKESKLTDKDFTCDQLPLGTVDTDGSLLQQKPRELWESTILAEGQNTKNKELKSLEARWSSEKPSSGATFLWFITTRDHMHRSMSSTAEIFSSATFHFSNRYVDILSSAIIFYHLYLVANVFTCFKAFSFSMLFMSWSQLCKSLSSKSWIINLVNFSIRCFQVIWDQFWAKLAINPSSVDFLFDFVGHSLRKVRPIYST